MPPKRRYEEIAAHYRRLIQDGELAPGDYLPSLRKVCDEFDVAMGTANRAFQLLKAENLTVATSEGTAVAHRPDVAVTGAARLKRMERTGQRYGPGETSTDHWRAMRSVADPVIAGLLDVELHDEIVIRRRVHRHEGGPSTFDSSFIHVRALGPVPELLDEGPLERWWQELYKERTGREVTRSPERRTARIISKTEIEALGIDLPPEVAASVLVVVNVFHDEDGPLEVWEDVYPPGAWQVDTE
ncbi:GntR family transcriptional regulator [Streptomyces sp. NPDC091292]|uniref:GntR family transcriptional regulator n=1 Tax=Streptomyces sp. NPDC091292 TaxID=3365991 RepID=UPI0038110869